MAEQASRLDVVQGTRTRVTIAQVNAGATLVAGVAGMTLRLIDAFIISIGGAAAAVTTVDIASTITIGKTGSAVTTATHFDVVLLWAAERA